jgi:predicted CDP-diglyceride synthetase/phosphatidate cytidylyltransferase
VLQRVAPERGLEAYAFGVIKDKCRFTANGSDELHRRITTHWGLIALVFFISFKSSVYTFITSGLIDFSSFFGPLLYKAVEVD